MLRRYETIFVTRADLPADDTAGMVERYVGIIEGMEGTIVELDKWGKRRLAYPIEKKRDGYYVRVDFVAEHKAVTEVERNFKIDENILRFQTVKLSDKVDMAAIEQEMAEARKKEEQKKEEALKREEARRIEEEKKAKDSAEPAVEVPEDQSSKADSEEGAEEVLPVAADDERAKEE